ncbi:MAG: hypothetical protein ACK4IX_13125 [Candidatus Sericytochromatia bacterium]
MPVIRGGDSSDNYFPNSKNEKQKEGLISSCSHVQESDLSSSQTTPGSKNNTPSTPVGGGSFAFGTNSETLINKMKGIRFYVHSSAVVDGLSFFVVSPGGDISKFMPIETSGNSTWVKQFFEFEKFTPNWKSFKGIGFASENEVKNIYIDDIWLYLNNQVKTRGDILVVNE